MIDAREKAIRQRLKNDFPHYASKCLRIRTKIGKASPLELNRGQLYVHERLEEQRARTGKVRALILKARQLGVSTFVGGRFYHRVTHSEGVRAFILTHEQDATDNLFDMTARFHGRCPELVKPATGASNAKELSFDRLDSGYKVGTAGSKGVGRSQTIQLFHGSEVAFWPHAETHMDGALQAVPDAPGTEVILESTANGVGGLFYSMCKAAERGEGEYILIFLPWFWHEEYRKAPPGGWQAPAEFKEYGELHGLAEDQVYWAYGKNEELCRAVGGDPAQICWKFRQEYPATAEEAFQTSGEAKFISPEAVMRARKNSVTPSDRTPLVIGVDVARAGGDKSRIIDRRGRKLGGLVNKTLDTDDLMRLAGEVVAVMNQHNPRQVFIDVTGLGAGVYDRLKELGHGSRITGVNFAQQALDPDRYSNKRAEMWDLLRQWFDDPAGVDIPDDDVLHSHLCAPIWGKGATGHNSSGCLVLEKKEHIKERLGFSPDGGDAAALTFAFPVAAEDAENLPPPPPSFGWMAA